MARRVGTRLPRQLRWRPPNWLGTDSMATWESRTDATIAVMESLSARLADVSLPDSEGNQVRLGSIWSGAPAVVVFLRHYG